MKATRREVLIAGAAAGAAALAGRDARAASRPLVISVLTCKRPRGVTYLPGTLAAVNAELSCERLLVCDGDPVEARGWRTIVVPARDRQFGQLPDNKVPGWVALRAALERGADLLFLEDDVRPLHKGAFSQMAAHQVPADVGFTSFFARLRRPGIYRADEFQMSQALKIPLRSLEVLADAEHRDALAWLELTGVDIAISVFGRIAGWKFEQTPNLVEHIGLWSAAHPT